MAAFNFPQKSTPLRDGETGVASLTHMGRTFRFRTNPNQFQWTYTLNKRIDQTYGGRVVQLLGTKIDDFVIKADAGGGRWDYTNRMAKFMRDVMINQRNGVPATFEYTKRGWKLNCYIVSVPFQDSVEEVLRPFEIQMKVQEDVSGLMSQASLRGELARLSDGIGFRRSAYNDPTLQGQKTVVLPGELGGVQAIADTAFDALNQLFGGIINPTQIGGGIYLPNGIPQGLNNIGRQ
jgi:hypothetical protein